MGTAEEHERAEAAGLREEVGRLQATVNALSEAIVGVPKLVVSEVRNVLEEMFPAVEGEHEPRPRE